MTSRRSRHDVDPQVRLAQLMGQARADPPVETEVLPDDQHWVDVSVDEPDPVPPPRAPWWRRGRTGQLIEYWTPATGAGPPRGRVFGLVALGGLVVAVLVAVTVAVSGPEQGGEAAPALPPAAGVATSSSGAPTSAPIVVSVVGRVVTPGLVTLQDGARVADALRAAGGPVPGVDVGGLNLARRLADGEQLYVGIPPPPGAEPAGAAADGQPGAGGPVDLNTASIADLDALPGVGPVTAQRIVDWRERNGRFATVEQLREIDGIGPARYDNLKDLVVAR